MIRTANIFLALTALALSGCASVRVVARETNPVEKEIFVEQCGWSSDLEGKKTEVRVSERGTIGEPSPFTTTSSMRLARWFRSDTGCRFR